MLKQSSLETPQGPMVVLADEAALYLLEFVGRPPSLKLWRDPLRKFSIL